LVITEFDVEVEAYLESGKRITVTWNTLGASRVRVFVGTQERFTPWREVPPQGPTTFELAQTLYRNPLVTLTAFSSAGDQLTEFVSIDWACEHSYFFADEVEEPPRHCPLEAVITSGAHQPFQAGSMTWLANVEGRDTIFVVYNDHTWNVYEDTWRAGDPEDDPDLVPPDGLLQPIRGFGKLWRENPEVRQQLGWAIGPESAFTSAYQRQVQESIAGVHYIRTIDDGVLRLNGVGGPGSRWEVFIP
jgi:hypothetical protein